MDNTAGQDELDELTVVLDDAEFHHTTEPEIASYARLTTAQSQEIINVDAVDSLEFSFGANPFWKIGKYDDAVFPSPFDSVKYIGYEEMIAGMEHLADEHPDRLNFYSVGQSAGYHNLLTGEDDRKGMWVVELTNDVNDEDAFTEKQKVCFSLSIHGNETAGREAGCRLIESILEGDKPEVEDHLDDVALLFTFTNPDGWVVRQPQYIGVINKFKRVNGAFFDRNRSHPMPGWIRPSHYPAAPRGQNLEDDQPDQIDDDVPNRTLEHAPGSLALIQWLRGHENLDAFVDLHGQGLDYEFVQGLISNIRQYNHTEHHDTGEMLRLIGEYIFDEIGPIEEHYNDIAPGMERVTLDPDDPEDREQLPNRLYGYSTWADTFNFTDTGGFDGWVAAPEEFGGLDINKSITPEMNLSITEGEVVQHHTPSLLDLQVRAYMATMHAAIDHTVSSVTAKINSNGRDTAVIYTDALTQSSDDLVFADTEKVEIDETMSIDAGGTETVTIDVPEKATQITVNIDHEGDMYTTLHNPDDAQIRTYNSSDENSRGAEWRVTNPVSDEWRIIIEHRDANTEEVTATVHINTLLTDDTDTANDEVLTPDPVKVLGYEQREYEATPFQFFENYNNYLDDEAEHDFVNTENVHSGALTDDRGTPVYENVVLIHDDDLDDIVDELDTFVEAGGNLVLTDTGVRALAQMDAAGAAAISDNDITANELRFASLDPAPQDPAAEEEADELPSRVPDHPLLEDTRWFTRELYTLPGIGYAQGEAPVMLMNPNAFEAADG